MPLPSLAPFHMTIDYFYYYYYCNNKGGKDGILDPKVTISSDETVFDVLQRKHPLPRPCHKDTLGSFHITSTKVWT